MSVVVIHQGDMRPDLQATLEHQDIGPVVLTDAVDVELLLTEVTDGTEYLRETATIFDAANGVVRYAWGVDQTNTPGTYVVQWRVTWDSGDVETFPPVGRDAVAITGNTVIPESGLTWGEVQIAVGRPLTPEEMASLPALLRSLVGAIGAWLHRPLIPTHFTNEVHWIPPWGTVLPNHEPITSMVSMTVVGGPEVAPYPPVWVPGAPTDWRNQQFLPGSSVALDYWAGTDLTSHPAVRQVLLDALTGSMLAGPAVASGAISSYSVEGTSITWATGGGQITQAGGSATATRITSASQKALASLKIPVWR